jgi:4-hydroxybenzoate polyprenyltransferase
MKFAAATLMLLSLLLMAVAVFAGFSYHFEGHGLHPLLAGSLAGFAALMGWLAAGKVEDI